MPISDTQKKLLTLLANGDFRSGTELAEAVGLSRSAVWKQLNGLSELGLHCVGVSGRGYRLQHPLEFLEGDKILAALEANIRSQVAIEIHDQLDSTNRYLAQKAQQGVDSSVACFAEYQTAGKGRRGRNWISPYGSNIYLSILWCFPQNGWKVIAGLSLAIGVAVIRALTQLQIPGIQLKWPNDLYHQDKKLGGILIEVSGEASGSCYAVIGLGLNVYLSINEAEKIQQPWTDLHRIMGSKKISRNTLAAALLNQLIPVISEFESVGIASYLAEWRAHDCLKDKPACLYSGNQPINGIARGIDDTGLFLLEHPDGHVQAYASGDISFHKPSA